MTDFRALCAELLQLEQEQPAQYTDWKMRYNAAIARARAALAQPEPQGPTDEELMALAVAVFEDPFSTDKDYARAVLARWGRPTIQEDYDRG
jgi:hypothetical protein